ncbi:MAG: Type 1 glutamine amidotransferase-like domain-containing protein [Gemmatimonadaceae bacterium]|nr:Type 1 glutamine amidotransferase-like domain-containing protein [Gemmatimonadaceae bacterium]
MVSRPARSRRSAFALPLAALIICWPVAHALAQQPTPPTPKAGTPRVGPPRGTVIVVGGGTMGPEIYRAFIDAAGGNESLLVTVPNAGGGDAYPQDGPSTRGWKQAGATKVHTYFTKDRTVADADSFVAVLQRAGGIWFEGGRQFRLVDAYGGTRSEAAFNAVLARGGVVGGSSAGASILGDFLVRGAPSNNNYIMDFPGYQKGFAYLKGVGVDQHVVARERLADLADSIIPRYPQLLGISEDEGTAWVIRGDTGTIIGRSKAFVYNGRDANDAGKPFLTLYPGDVYDLGARRVMRRAYEGSAVTPAFIDALFARYRDSARGGATVLVARDGKVLADRAYGIAPQPRYMPETTVPQFALGEMSAIFGAVCEQLPEPPVRARPANDTAAAPAAAPAATPTTAASRAAPAALTPMQRCVTQRAAAPVGLHKTTANDAGEVQSSVDELYRVSLGLEHPPTYARTPATDAGAREPIDGARGWMADQYAGATRYRAFAAADGKRSAWVRIPSRRVTIIILTNDATADAAGMADAIAGKLLGTAR